MVIDPDVEVVAVEVGGDGRQRRTDDGLVERAEEEAEHDREEDLHLLAVAQAERGILLERSETSHRLQLGSGSIGQSFPWAWLA